MKLSRTETENLDKKIELILILQSHKVHNDLSSEFVSDPEETEAAVYSQLKIMQALTSDNACKNATILAESNRKLVNPEGRNSETTHIFKLIFPDYHNLQALDYYNLTYNQKTVLYNNQAVTILYHLTLIDFIYPTTEPGSVNYPATSYAYGDAYKKHLLQFPNLVKVITSGRDTTLKLECITAKDQSELQKFNKNLRKEFPVMFYDREKKALDYVLKAANQTNNKRAILIFGASHLDGIIELIETQYKDKIELIKIIDTTIGCLTKNKEEWLEKTHKEAILCHNDGTFDEAIIHFKNIVKFWHATPPTTPRRTKSLLAAEFNLGSTLLLSSNSDPSQLEEALNHLKLANNLALSVGPHKKDNKYTKRYKEALAKLEGNKQQNSNFQLSDRIQDTNPLTIYNSALKDIHEKNYNQAVIKLDQAYLEFEKKVGKDSEECLKCCSALISCYRDLNNYNKAIQNAEEVIDYYFGKKNIKSVIKKYYECLTLREDKDKAIYTQSIQDYKIEHYQLALYKLLFIIESNNQEFTPAEIASCHSTISSCYRELKLYDLAKKHCEDALGLRRKLFKHDDKLVIDLEHKLAGIISLMNSTNTTSYNLNRQ